MSRTQENKFWNEDTELLEVIFDSWAPFLVHWHMRVCCDCLWNCGELGKCMWLKAVIFLQSLTTLRFYIALFGKQRFVKRTANFKVWQPIVYIQVEFYDFSTVTKLPSSYSFLYYLCLDATPVSCRHALCCIDRYIRQILISDKCKSKVTQLSYRELSRSYLCGMHSWVSVNVCILRVLTVEGTWCTLEQL